MKKYMRGIICLVFSLLKFLFLKIFHFQKFKFTIFNLFSPFTDIEIDKSATLTIGKFVKARSGTKIKVRKKGVVNIGENTFFNHNCMVFGYEKIIIGKNVQFGPNVLIYDHDHDFRSKDGIKSLKYKTSPIKIGDDVWIGANSIILRNTKIGANSVIGAGSVIKGEYPSNSIIIQKKDEVVHKYKTI
jgi:acetyltransferase-like isoleucine patch superfamily enzyme